MRDLTDNGIVNGRLRDKWKEKVDGKRSPGHGKTVLRRRRLGKEIKKNVPDAQLVGYAVV